MAMNVFEFCLFFCLAVSSVVVFYAKDRYEFHEGQANTIMSIALLMLLSMTLYNTYNRVSETKRGPTG